MLMWRTKITFRKDTTWQPGIQHGRNAVLHLDNELLALFYCLSSEFLIVGPAYYM